MKKGDTLFKEQFIVLHDGDEEIIIKKSEISSLHINNNYGNKETYIVMKNSLQYYVNESIDEILELL